MNCQKKPNYGGCEWAGQILQASKESKKNSERAAGAADRAEEAACRAEMTAEQNGFVDFEIVDGRLIMTKSENLKEIDFSIENGRMVIKYGDED